MKLFKKIIPMLLMLLMATGALAQTTVVGTVLDENSEPVVGATVLATGTNVGAITDLEGRFSIDVPDGVETLTISYLGYRNVVRSVSDDFSSVQLDTDEFGLDAVVVTGTSVGTETKKLGFVVEQVTGKDLEEVPAANPANALRAKAPGITIVQPSGNPSSATSIRLRGATSINGSAEPLIIVDGIITNGDLRDINMEDVESIEVVKGAAAASLYGSRAGNGIVQIITKKGRVSKPTFTVRQEIGATDLLQQYPTATTHPWLLDDNGFFAVDDTGARIPDPDGLYDNAFPQLFDTQGDFFEPQMFNTTYASFSSNTDKSQFHVSGQLTENDGIIETLDPYVRNNFRGNFTSYATDKIKVTINASYADSEGIDLQEQGQGQFNFFESLLSFEPFLDINERGEDGEFLAAPTGFDVLGGQNTSNPNYVSSQRQFGFNRDRLLGRIEATYDLTENITLRASQAIDYENENGTDYVPVGFIDPNPTSTLPLGSLSRFNAIDTYLTREFDIRYNKSILNEDVKMTLVGRYLGENNQVRVDGYSSFDFFDDIQSIEFSQAENRDAFDFGQDLRAAAYIGNAIFDYKDKLIIDGLYRHEAFSQNGPDNQWNPFGRIAVAYIPTEDFDMGKVNFMKIRGSYGSAGNRPAYSYIYTNSTPTATGVEPTTSGNPDLVPSVITDAELGITLGFLDKYQLNATYINSNTENDFLFLQNSPISGNPFTGQWQNIAGIQTNGFEVNLQGSPLKSGSLLDWNFNLSFDTENTEVSDLGNFPTFTRNGGGAVDLFRFEEGVQIGTMYGGLLASSADQLTVDANGDVIAAPGYVFGESTNLKPSDFTVNDHGYVVVAGSEGTADEQPMYILNEEGAVASNVIGNTIPDFKIGLSNTFQVKNFSLFGVMDWQQGGDVYNYNKQRMYFNDRHGDHTTFAAEGKHGNYSNASSSLYNGANASSHFVEDASFVKIREIALGYTLGGDNLGGFLGDKLQEVKLNLSGRNLFTFTNYTGWDPEVALGTNSTYYAVDEFSYPNFRIFSGTVQVKF